MISIKNAIKTAIAKKTAVSIGSSYNTCIFWSFKRMKRLFILVLAAAQFIFYLIDTWPSQAVLWIRCLGGKLGLANDLDGPYLVLRGLSALFQTFAALTFVAVSPFPRLISTYG